MDTYTRKLYVHPSEPFKQGASQSDADYRKEYLCCKTCCVPSMYELREQVGDYSLTNSPELVAHYCGNCLHIALTYNYPHSSISVRHCREYASNCN